MAKAKINPPNHPTTHVSYQRECQMALEPSLTTLLEMAEQAGWDASQASYAVMILAAERLKEHHTQAPDEVAEDR